MKKSKIRINSGKLRGKIIPFDNIKFEDADISPQRVKGAAFSILGENLSGMRFLDLFACSGQMGLEALSRGAEFVTFVEKNRKRYGFVREFVQSLWPPLPSMCQVINGDALDFIHSLGKNLPHIVYVDPPYIKGKGSAYSCSEDIYLKVMSSLGKKLNDRARVLVQHFWEHELPERFENLEIKKKKKYGTTCLSLYELTSFPER